MTASEIEEKVRELVGRIGKIEAGFGREADLFRELGMKSAAALDLLLSMEEEFGVTISDDAFGEARTTAQLVSLVVSLKGEGA